MADFVYLIVVDSQIVARESDFIAATAHAERLKAELWCARRVSPLLSQMLSQTAPKRPRRRKAA